MSGLPGVDRGEWRLVLPAMRRLELDGNGIPTGAEEAFDLFDSRLGDRAFDDGFRLASERETFAVWGARRRIGVELLTGYRYAQVYTPAGQDLVALEPMTAPTNALASGRGLSIVEPGGRYRAAFRIVVADSP